MKKMSSLTFPDGSSYEVVDDNARYNIKDINNELYKVKSAVGFSKKQLIPYPYVDNSKTQYGIEFTDNGNGTLSVNGTKTEKTTAYFTCRSRQSSDSNKMMLKAGTYNVTGCPTDGGTTGNGGYYLQVGCSDSSGNWVTLADDVGDGATFTITKETQIQVVVRVHGITTVSNLLFKPMIKYANIEDNTYESYVPSRNELDFYVKTVDLDNIAVSSNTNGDYVIQAVLNDNEVLIGLAGYNIANASTNGYGGSFATLYKVHPNAEGDCYNISIKNNNTSKEIRVRVYLYLIIAKNLH